MNDIAAELSHNELIERPVDSTQDSQRVELGDDTGEIPWALMEKFLNS